MTQEQLYLDAVNKADDLLQAMEREKKHPSSALVRTGVNTAKNALSMAITKVRMAATKTESSKRISGYMSAQNRFLGR